MTRADQSSRDKPSPNFKDILRSDKLPTLLNLANSISAVSPFLDDFVRFTIVLDASVANEHLRWLLGKRKNLLATTSIHEAIVSGAVIAFAPSYIEGEIIEHEAEIASDTGKTVDEVHQLWVVMRGSLHLYPMSEVPEEIRQLVDHDDEPYRIVRKQVGASAIFTRDGHFKQMGEPVVMDQIDLALRDYARASTVKIGVSIGSGVAFAISFEMIPVLYNILMGAFNWLKRQSPASQIAIISAALLVAIHPKTRAKCLQVWKSVAPILNETLGATASRLAVEYAEATHDADMNLRAIQSAFPPPHRRTLIMHARAACIMAKRPLSLDELEVHIRRDGYKSQAVNFRAYLRRLLRNDTEFVELTTGGWTFAAHQQHS